MTTANGEKCGKESTYQSMRCELPVGHEGPNHAGRGGCWLLICDACNVRPDWKGEHRCHTANGQKEMIAYGKRVHEFCECAVCVPLRISQEKRAAE